MSFFMEQLWLRRLVALLVLALVWELLSRLGVLNPFYVPPPSEVMRVLVTLFVEG